MCPNDKIKKDKGFISTELFKSLVDCVRDKFEAKTLLGLGAWGEPLLHPQFKEFLAYADQQGVKTKMASNCVNLDKEAAEAIAVSKMALFEISLYSIKKERYNKMTGNNTFEVVFNNVHNFLKIAAEKKYQGRIRLRPFEIYSDELAEYKKEFYDRYPDLNFERQWPKELSNWAGFLPLRDSFKKIYVRKPCFFCFSRLAVDYDGEVKICCQAMLADDLLLGQLDKNCDLSDIWNGEKLKDVRDKISKLNYDDFPSCRKCSNTRRYLKISDLFKLNL
jgi:radical SAM protein with 4Fe4S-binding SPASM domain